MVVLEPELPYHALAVHEGGKHAFTAAQLHKILPGRQGELAGFFPVEHDFRGEAPLGCFVPEAIREGSRETHGFRELPHGAETHLQTQSFRLVIYNGTVPGTEADTYSRDFVIARNERIGQFIAPFVQGSFLYLGHHVVDALLAFT